MIKIRISYDDAKQAERALKALRSVITGAEVRRQVQEDIHNLQVKCACILLPAAV